MTLPPIPSGWKPGGASAQATQGNPPVQPGMTQPSQSSAIGSEQPNLSPLQAGQQAYGQASGVSIGGQKPPQMPEFPLFGSDVGIGKSQTPKSPGFSESVGGALGNYLVDNVGGALSQAKESAGNFADSYTRAFLPGFGDSNHTPGGSLQRAIVATLMGNKEQASIESRRYLNDAVDTVNSVFGFLGSPLKLLPGKSGETVGNVLSVPGEIAGSAASTVAKGLGMSGKDSELMGKAGGALGNLGLSYVADTFDRKKAADVVKGVMDHLSSKIEIPNGKSLVDLENSPLSPKNFGADWNAKSMSESFPKSEFDSAFNTVMKDYTKKVNDMQSKNKNSVENLAELAKEYTMKAVETKGTVEGKMYADLALKLDGEVNMRSNGVLQNEYDRVVEMQKNPGTEPTTFESLAGIDQHVKEHAMENPAAVHKYTGAMDKANLSNRNPGPVEVFRDTAMQTAQDKVKAIMDSKGSEVGKAKEQAANMKANPTGVQLALNKLDEVMAESQIELALGKDGRIEYHVPKGNVTNWQANEISEMQTLRDKMETAKANPTVQNIQAVIDSSKRSANFQNEKYGPGKVSPTQNPSRLVGERLAKLRDETMGPSAEAFRKYAEYRNFLDDYRNAGSEARTGVIPALERIIKGNGLPEDRAVFEKIKSDTGIDLISEYTIAKHVHDTQGSVGYNARMGKDVTGVLQKIGQGKSVGIVDVVGGIGKRFLTDPRQKLLDIANGNIDKNMPPAKGETINVNQNGNPRGKVELAPRETSFLDSIIPGAKADEPTGPSIPKVTPQQFAASLPPDMKASFQKWLDATGMAIGNLKTKERKSVLQSDIQNLESDKARTERAMKGDFKGL